VPTAQQLKDALITLLGNYLWKGVLPQDPTGHIVPGQVELEDQLHEDDVINGHERGDVATRDQAHIKQVPEAAMQELVRRGCFSPKAVRFIHHTVDYNVNPYLLLHYHCTHDESELADHGIAIGSVTRPSNVPTTRQFPKPTGCLAGTLHGMNFAVKGHLRTLSQCVPPSWRTIRTCECHL
jgi:hypothetical protein